MRSFQRQQSTYILGLAFRPRAFPESCSILPSMVSMVMLDCSQTLSIHWLTARLCCCVTRAHRQAVREPAGVEDSHIELHALVVQQRCKVVPAGQAPVCQLQAGAHVHAPLLANLDAVHCRLSCRIRSVVGLCRVEQLPRRSKSRCGPPGSGASCAAVVATQLYGARICRRACSKCVLQLSMWFNNAPQAWKARVQSKCKTEQLVVSVHSMSSHRASTRLPAARRRL